MLFDFLIDGKKYIFLKYLIMLILNHYKEKNKLNTFCNKLSLNIWMKRNIRNYSLNGP